MILGLISDHQLNERKLINGGQIATMNGIGIIQIVTGTVVIIGKKQNDIWPDVNTVGNDIKREKTIANDGTTALINKTIHPTAIGHIR